MLGAKANGRPVCLLPLYFYKRERVVGGHVTVAQYSEDEAAAKVGHRACHVVRCASFVVIAKVVFFVCLLVVLLCCFLSIHRIHYMPVISPKRATGDGAICSIGVRLFYGLSEVPLFSEVFRFTTHGELILHVRFARVGVTQAVQLL